ncbi:15637_t:CDS:2 [Funneliformis caledonium]|uniref:15637_t:CDS:1 n=1 Tax=Funneliformis caledonium TaxID=1117310 RepID=A0A9N9G644_9GLOM|nr:15637_t:CDS:2 [Funneliformis caledonium]
MTSTRAQRAKNINNYENTKDITIKTSKFNKLKYVEATFEDFVVDTLNIDYSPGKIIASLSAQLKIV